MTRALLLLALASPALAGYAVHVYTDGCSALPRPEATPVVGALVRSGAHITLTAWQGAAYLHQDAEAVDVRLPGETVWRELSVRQTSGCAVMGYVARSASGTRLVYQTAPAQLSAAVYAARVSLDGRSIMPMDDGAFTFDTEPGPHTLTAWAIFGGQVRHMQTTIVAEPGKTVMAQGYETASEPAPPLSFFWTSTLTRWGTPTGYYMATCVVDREGNRPTDVSADPMQPNYFRLHLASMLEASVAGTKAAQVNGNAGYELTRDGDVTATATLGATTIRQTVIGEMIHPGDHIVQPSDITFSPNPIVRGKPALIRWQAVGDVPAAGASISIDDRYVGHPATVRVPVRPDLFGGSASYRNYYPRSSVMLSAADTAGMVAGAVYVVTVNLATTLDAATVRQTSRTAQAFTVVGPGEIAPEPAALAQADLPLSDTGTFDGYLYFAEPPHPGRPVADALALSPVAVPVGIPAGGAHVTHLGRQTTTSRDGHLHLRGVSPGPLTLGVDGVVNPTTGEAVSGELTVRLREPLAGATGAVGTVVCYLYAVPGGLRVSPESDPAATPFLAARAIIDTPVEQVTPTSAIRLPDTDGAIVVPRLSAGVHQVRLEAYGGGSVYTVDCAVDVVGGAITSIEAVSSTVAPAAEFNVLAAQSYTHTGMHSDNETWLVGVDRQGTFPKYTSSTNNFRVGFGPKDKDSNHIFQSADQDSLGQWWWYLWNPNYCNGQWHLGGAGRSGRFRVWRNAAAFDTPDGLLLETPPCDMAMGPPIGMPQYVQTYPSPIVAGRPAVVRWGPATGAQGYVMWIERLPLFRPLIRPGDPYPAMRRSRDSRVEVLSGVETGQLMAPAQGPYCLSVYAVDSPYWSRETQHAWQYTTVNPVLEAAQ